VAAESIRPLVQAHPGNAVEQFEEFPAQSMNEVQPGVYVYDLGQNMVGWARLKVKGEAGQRVQVRHAEMLQSDGSLYTVSLRKARAIDSYILSGHGAETLEPKFTFHGFRYVELTGLDKPPTPKDVVGVVLYSPLPQTGFFECSEPLLNQLYHNILWGQRGNYLEAPTDCPQRDERCGWTGDAQFFMPTSALVSDVSAFFTKWLVDLVQDAQLEDGSWADVAPNIGLGGGNVAWGDAAIICTYQMYRYYGDKRVLAQHYDYLMKGMQFLENSSENYIRKKLGYGDWLNLGGNAKDEVICTAYFAYLAGLMREMAEIIGRTPEAEHYAALEKNIKDAFVKNFIREDGSILDSSQTGYALAFTMDLIPDELKAKAAEHFQKEIERFDNHLATGFIGTPRLLPALSLAGKQDVAYQLLMNKTFPSWLFQVTLGATTMWERWDGWTPDKGFQDPGMNSFNHYAFGAVGEYLFTTVGGIQATAPGFSKIRIAPVPGGGLTWAKTRYDSIHGAIRSEWRIENGKFLLEVEIPANMEAVVELPSGLTDVAASDTVLAKPLEGAARGTAFTIQSGVCRFEARIS
ncbi:MAG: family 78 glycoside hydrolase catalytic domain, partial [Candidatus Hydrogenedentes bacterium]|nr:family 78 glycoside hydrolase catalytic domain [Candidatus Hydrogenedentota bacterium]